MSLYAPYSSDLASIDFDMFGSLKEETFQKWWRGENHRMHEKSK